MHISYNEYILASQLKSCIQQRLKTYFFFLLNLITNINRNCYQQNGHKRALLCLHLDKNLQHITLAPSNSTTEFTLTFRLSLPPLTYPARSCFVVSCNKFQFTVYICFFLLACKNISVAQWPEWPESLSEDKIR